MTRTAELTPSAREAPICGTCDGAGRYDNAECGTCEGLGRVTETTAEWLREDSIRRRIAAQPRARVWQAAASLAVRSVGANVIWRDDAAPMAHVFSPDKRVIAPRPTSAGTVARLLHELGHIALHRRKAPTETGWKGEADASRWAMRFWSDCRLPEREQAAHELGALLMSYLRQAVRDGETTAQEIRASVPNELLGYIARLEQR